MSGDEIFTFRLTRFNVSRLQPRPVADSFLGVSKLLLERKPPPKRGGFSVLRVTIRTGACSASGGWLIQHPSGKYAHRL